MSDENLEEFDFPVKEGFEMKKETTEDAVVEEEEVAEEAKTEEEVKKDVAESNEDEILKEIGAAKKEVEDTEKEVVSEEKEVEEKVEEEIKEEAQVEAEEIDTSSLISEEISKLTEGSFSSVEELNQAYNDILEVESGKGYIEKLNDAVEAEYGEGIAFSDLVEYKSKDFDSMSPMDVLVEQLQLSDGDITDAEIEAELRPYALLNRSEAEIAELIEDEKIEAHEVKDLEARLLRKTRAAKSELKEFQDSIDIDNLEISSPKMTEQKSHAPSEEEQKANLERYEAAINGLPDLKFDVGTKEEPFEFTFKITDEDRNGIDEFLKAEEKDGVSRDFIQKNWTDENGVNVAKLSADMYKVVNYERDIKRAFANGKSEVSKEVKDISNIDFKKGESTKAPVSDARSQAAQLAAEANN